MMRKGLLGSLALALLVSMSPANAVPPVAGGAIASANVELVANIPDLAAIGGTIRRDIETPLGPRDLLYVTTGNGLQIFDVTQGLPVPAGALELPHFENEDVDTNGRILLIAADHFLGVPNMLYVIDVSLPHAPLLKGVLPFPSEAHTISCINDCTYAYLAGSTGLFVVDLRNPAAPRQVGRVAESIGRTHDVQIDDAGIAWVTGSTVSAWSTGDARTPSFYAAGTPLAPKQVAGQDGRFNNNFILHNSMRPQALAMDPAKLGDTVVDPGEVVFVTEEDYIVTQEDGSFQAGHLRLVNGALQIVWMDRWTFGNDLQVDVGNVGHKVAVGFSSSHYFDWRDGVMAVAWYEQGTRFFDVSDPADIRPIGYFLPLAGNETWNVLFNGDWIYTIDVGRGIDVLHFTGSTSSATVELPEIAKPALSAPDPRFGACRIFAPAA